MKEPAVSHEAAVEFLHHLQEEVTGFADIVATKNGDWAVKGFIDVFKNIYTISGGTKVISKIIELMLFPLFAAFAERYGLKLVLCKE